MVGLALFFGVLLVLTLFLIITLVRRGRRNNHTENADGLLVEQERRLQAQYERYSHDVTVYNVFPNRNDRPHP